MDQLAGVEVTQDGIEGLPYICLSDVSGAMEVAGRTERARIIEYLRSQLDSRVMDARSRNPLIPSGPSTFAWFYRVLDKIESNDF